MFKKINSLLLIGFLTTNVAYANDTFFPRKHEFFPNNELKNDRVYVDKNQRNKNEKHHNEKRHRYDDRDIGNNYYYYYNNNPEAREKRTNTVIIHDNGKLTISNYYDSSLLYNGSNYNYHYSPKNGYYSLNNINGNGEVYISSSGGNYSNFKINYQDKYGNMAVKNGQLNFVNGYSIYKDVNFSKNKYCILRFDMVDYRTIEVSQNGDCDFDNYVNVSGRYRR